MARKRTREIDNSLNDFIARVRAAFDEQFGRRAEFLLVTDVFDDYVIVREEGGQHFRVTMDAGDDDDISFAPEREWEQVRLSYVTETLDLQQRSDVMLVWELRGDYPDVPIMSDVNYQDLVSEDDDPTFVTLPIGKVNALSGNRRFYDNQFVQELERQVLANKPVGLMGHLKPEDRATEFPPEAVHWVGVRRVGELLWGKGYVPPGEARERIKRYKAQNKKISTSIDAWVEGKWDQTLNAYRINADSLRLNQIDIAPADRAGIADLAAVPLLSTEMGAQPDNTSKENDMNKLDVIREMSVEDARLLPDDVRQSIVDAVSEAPEVALVAEIRDELGLEETADLVGAIREMKETQEEQARRAVTERIKELVEDEDEGIKLESVRGLVTEMIELRRPETPQEAEEAFQEVVKSERVQSLLSEMVQTTMGPPQGNGVAGQQGAAKYFAIPEGDES